MVKFRQLNSLSGHSIVLPFKKASLVLGTKVVLVCDLCEVLLFPYFMS